MCEEKKDDADVMSFCNSTQTHTRTHSPTHTHTHARACAHTHTPHTNTNFSNFFRSVNVHAHSAHSRDDQHKQQSFFLSPSGHSYDDQRIDARRLSVKHYINLRMYLSVPGPDFDRQICKTHTKILQNAPIFQISPTSHSHDDQHTQHSSLVLVVIHMTTKA